MYLTEDTLHSARQVDDNSQIAGQIMERIEKTCIQTTGMGTFRCDETRVDAHGFLQRFRIKSCLCTDANLINSQE